MTRILTWDEVRTNAIPRPEAFDHVGRLLRQELAAESAVIGALLYGSLLRGDYDQRSDINALLVYRPGEQMAIAALQQRLRSAAACRFVPIRVIAVDSELAGRGDHSFYPTYYAHLCWAACCEGSIIKEDPLRYLAPIRITYIEEVQNYLVRKCESFDRAIESLTVMNDAELAVALGEALSIPIQGARMMLQYLAPELMATNDGKMAVSCWYPRLGIPQSFEAFFELLGFESRYSEGLIEQQRMPDINQHAILMSRLKPALFVAHQFAQLNLRALPPIPKFLPPL